MKIIKEIVSIFCFLISLSFYGQTNDSLQNVNSIKFDSFNPGFFSADQPFFPKKLNIQTKTTTLLLYNKTTNLYDTYLKDNEDYSYIGSNTKFKHKSNFFTTLFLGNDSFIENNSPLSHRSLLLDDGLNYRIRDSFNPYGASNFSEALIGGVLGLLFN